MVPEASLVFAAKVQAYKATTPKMNNPANNNAINPSYWMNPFGISDLFGIVTPVDLDIAFRIDLIQAAAVVNDLSLAAAALSIAIAAMGADVYHDAVAASEFAAAAYAATLVVVPMRFIIGGGIVSPGGLRPRYPTSAGDMALEVIIITDLSSVEGMIFNSAAMINATNIKLGRALYAAGLYKLDDLALSINALIEWLHFPQDWIDAFKLMESVLLQPMHSLLDLLDQISVDLFTCVLNMYYITAIALTSAARSQGQH
jgi:hypothetical protein